MTKIKKVKYTKKCIIKRKRKFGDHKNCLEATQLEDKINQLDKNKINIESLKENHKKFIKNNKIQEHIVSTEEDNNIPLSSNNNNRVQSIKDLVFKKATKCNNIINNTKMINFDDVGNENIKEHNWPQILDHPYSILITEGSASPIEFW